MVTVNLKIFKKARTIEISALIDSEAGENFIYEEVITQNDFEIQTLMVPLLAYNVDRTLNKEEQITCFSKTEVNFREYKELIKFYVSGIGR